MHSVTNRHSESTTLVWQLVRIPGRPESRGKRAAGGNKRWRTLKRISRSQGAGLHICLASAESPDGWIRVTARGQVGYFHGHTPIYDVLTEVCHGGTFPFPER